jgi:hypothetical protein
MSDPARRGSAVGDCLAGGAVCKHGEGQFRYPLRHSTPNPPTLVVAGLCERVPFNAPGHRQRKAARNRYHATSSTPCSRRQNSLDPPSTCAPAHLRHCATALQRCGPGSLGSPGRQHPKFLPVSALISGPRPVPAVSDGAA